ncbi:hypothetical protein AB0O22_19145 [Streptomyces sp. NPDC091204]|uniref:hypothetical protein n=1 Tax=Streptomyces sp. NPDC091204 TaxID=3155299 RepID=UPI00341A674A
MLSLPALRDLRLTELTEAADGWRKVSGGAHAADQRVESEMLKPLKETQVGEAATAAYKRLGRVRQNFRYVYTECALIETALKGLALELEGLQRKLAHALEDARQLGFTVLDDGGVGYPAAGTPDTGGTLPEGGVVRGRRPGHGFFGREGGFGKGDNPNEERARALADTIWSALNEAGEINSQYKGAMAAYFVTPDGFQLSVVVGWKDQPHFRVTTPPAEPSEVAPPTTPPHGPDYRHKEVPEPDQFHPFWSVPQAPRAGD